MPDTTILQTEPLPADELKALCGRITVEQDETLVLLQIDGMTIYGVSGMANAEVDVALRRFGELCDEIAGRRPVVPFNDASSIILRDDGEDVPTVVTTWGDFKRDNADGMDAAAFLEIASIIRTPGAWYLIGGGAEPVTFIARTRAPAAAPLAKGA